MQLNGRDERERLAVVYLVPWYPAVSPTFVLREVQALRRLGRQVSTVSIHRPPPEDVLAEADREAYDTTYFLSPPRLRDHVSAHWQALRTRPRAYVSTLAAALRAGPVRTRGEGSGAPVLLRGGRGVVARPAVRSASYPRRVRGPGRRRRHAGGPARRRGLELEPRRARHRHAPDSTRQSGRQDPLRPICDGVQRLRAQSAHGAGGPGALVQDPGRPLRGGPDGIRRHPSATRR